MRMLVITALAAILAAGLAWGGVAKAQEKEHDSLSRILITSEGEQDGRVIDGYVIKKAKNFSVFHNKEVKDVPYTINVVGEDFMNNLGTMTPRDVFRRIPGVDDNAHSEINLFSYIHARGFQVTGNNNLGINGVPTGNIGAILFTEDLSSIEVFSGLSGYLYGIGNVGGMANYNTKRGIFEPARKIRYGTYNNGSLFVHADLGGPVVDDKLAYRLNMLIQDGKTAIKPQSLDRKLVSAAMDWRVTDDLLIQVNASYGEHFQQGRQGAFTAEWNNGLALDANFNTYATNTGVNGAAHFRVPGGVPAPPDPEKLWVSKDTFNDYKATVLGANLTYKINDYLNLRSAILYNRWKRRTLMTINYFTTDPDVYEYGVAPLIWDRKHLGGYLYLDANFNTGFLEHQLIIGFNSYFKEDIGAGSGGEYKAYLNSSFSLADAVNQNLNGLNLFSMLGPVYKSQDDLGTTVLIGDTIKINDQWEVMAGIAKVDYRVRTFGTDGSLSARRSFDAFTPQVALVYKPTPWLTTYASYIESLETGSAVAPNTAVNRGEIFDPTKSYQYEVGAKAKLADVYLTMALYQIDRTTGYTDPATSIYSLTGRARHTGIELSAQGRLFESLNIYGGVTFNDSKVRVDANRNIVGKEVPDAPRFTGKLYVEYDLPFLDGMTITGSINHYGKVFTNTFNNLSIPGRTIGDLGFRYAANILGQDMAWRFNVQNITNKAYWYGGTGSHLVIGQPRSFSLIGELNF